VSEINSYDRINIKTWSADTCLIDQLVSYLSEKSREDISKHTIILPTTRLGTFVRASLAKHFGALRPPKLCTLEQFIREQAHLTNKTWKTCNSTHIELILANLLKKNSFIHLRSGHERELALFFEELVKNNIYEEGFTQLEETIKKDIYRSQEQLGSLYDRCIEIKVLWEQFNQLLHSKTLYTPENALKDQSHTIVNHWNDLAISHQPIMTVAFTSVSPSVLPLITKISESESLNQLWFHEPPKLLTKTNPLADLLSKLEPERKPHSPTPNSSPASINSAPTAYLEVQCVIDDINKLLTTGVAASKIAVLVTNETTYGKYLRVLCHQLPCSANIALSMPLSQTPVGGWIQAFTQIFTTNEATHAVLSWVCHPISLARCQESTTAPEINRVTEESVQRLSRQNIQRNLDAISSSADNEDEKKLWKVIEGILTPFRKRGQRPLSHWLKELTSFIKLFRPYLEKSINESAVNRSSLTVIDQFIDEISEFATELEIKMNTQGFCQWINSQLLKQEVRSTGEPLAGVQIISLPEARSFPFHSVFILGCNEGSFPKSLPKDDLLDDFLKRRMGLPGWQALEGREDLTFQLLLTRIPHLHLFYSENKLHEPMVRSRFIEHVLAYSGLKVTKRAKSLSFENSNPDIELPHEGFFENYPEELTSQYSATSLETLIHCPYRFLLSRLRIKKLTIPGIDPDPRNEGEWLHKVLEEFFDRWPKDLEESSFEKFAVTKLLKLSIECGPTGLEESSLYMHLRDFSWPRFASHLSKILAVVGFESAKLSLREHRFSYEKVIAGKAVTLRGSIDYVLPVDGDHSLQLITDYKRKGLPSKKSIVTGTSPQLAVYSQAIPKEAANSIIAGYWSILDATWQIAVLGSDAKDLGKRLDLLKPRPESLDSYTNKVDELWEWRLNDIQHPQGRFTADPTDCNFCTFENICRRDDPRHKERLQEQNELEQRLRSK